MDTNTSNNLSQPENSAIQNEENATILEFIKSLPSKHRIVLTLFYYSDMSIQQISNILNCSEGTVKSRLFHAKDKLRKALSNKGFNIDNSEKEEFIRAIR